MEVIDQGFKVSEAYNSSGWRERKAFLEDSTVAKACIVWSEAYDQQVKFRLIKHDGTESGTLVTDPSQIRKLSVEFFQYDIELLVNKNPGEEIIRRGPKAGPKPSNV